VPYFFCSNVYISRMLFGFAHVYVHTVFLFPYIPSLLLGILSCTMVPVVLPIYLGFYTFCL
jgi:hypothetical protein